MRNEIGRRGRGCGTCSTMSSPAWTGGEEGWDGGGEREA